MQNLSLDNAAVLNFNLSYGDKRIIEVKQRIKETGAAQNYAGSFVMEVFKTSTVLTLDDTNDIAVATNVITIDFIRIGALAKGIYSYKLRNNLDAETSLLIMKGTIKID